MKNPIIAAILSFIITGAGQVYNGDIKKGLKFFIIEIILILSIYFIIGIILAPIFWIYCAYEAYNTAENMSKKKEHLVIDVSNRCSSCKNLNDETASFCTFCGHKL